MLLICIRNNDEKKAKINKLVEEIKYDVEFPPLSVEPYNQNQKLDRIIEILNEPDEEYDY